MRTLLPSLFAAGLAMIFTTVVANVARGTPVDPAILEAEWATIDGRTIHLAEFRGDRPVYLKFWASWCGTCREEMPHLESVYREHGDDLTVVAVNLGINDDREAVLAAREEFGLSMPIVIDRDGRLAQAFDLAATPYHVLLDQRLRVVHAEYSASDGLDEKIRRLAAGNGRALQAIETVTNREHDAGPAGTVPAKTEPSGGLEVLFFIATWCDWYLEDTRPAMSRNCIDAQRVVNTLHRRYPDLEWTGVASRMWTGKEELDAYRDRFDVKHDLAIDTSNRLVLRHDIRQFPTLLITNDGEEILRIDDFGNSGLIAREIENAVSRVAGLRDQGASRGP